MKTTSRLAVCLLLLSTLSSPLRTAVAQGTAFTYQGRLNDGANPAAGIYDLRFAVYDSVGAGTLVAGPLTNSATGITNGLFTATLNFGGIFTGTNYWLDIGVRSNGATAFTVLTPRQPITPSPYAIFANTAGNLSGPLADARLSSNVALRAGGNTFSGDQIFNGDIDLNSTNGFDQSSVGNFYIDAPFIAGGRFAVLENGNVGIGNSVPFYKLDVNGDVNLSFPSTIYSGGTPLLHVDSLGNFFGGLFAGNLTLSGFNNVGVGYAALYGDTNGSYNTANGVYALFSNSTGSNNVANGASALRANTGGSDNTAVGYQALYSNTTGSQNIALGSLAGYNITTGNSNIDIGNPGVSADNNVIRIGSGQTATYVAGTLNARSLILAAPSPTSPAIYSGGGLFLFEDNDGNFFAGLGAGASVNNANNTGVGFSALGSDTVGFNNVAVGWHSAANTTSGNYNTAIGCMALYTNTTGAENAADGFQALYSNATGSDNAAMGSQALYSNAAGTDNAAMGSQALYSNVVGGDNTAFGRRAAYSNQASYNTAIGFQALFSATSGDQNLALGYQAGYNITTGQNNIDIENPGSSTDVRTIRIGSQGLQTNTFIAGVSGVPVSGGAVVVNSSGQLGVAPSSQRFKQNIHRMDDASAALLALQPVTFQYKPDIDPQGIAQFGLIAEQVEKVDPDLVVHDQEHGIYTVRYEAVNAMLLNEFLKEHRKVEEQTAKLEELRKQMDSQNFAGLELQRKNAALEQRLDALEEMIRNQKSD